MLKRLLSAFAIMLAGQSQALAENIDRHTDWNSLLSSYVEVNVDGVNRFDYARLKRSEEDVVRLNRYLDSFRSVDLDGLSRDAKFAAYVNIYNALTVKHIIGRYPVRSIRSGYISGPWKRVKTMINGVQVSLDTIEHDILREMGDPRVHYALNCASYSCPNLQTVAFTDENLDGLLDQAARDYVNHPRGVSIRQRGGLEVSSIYVWFKKDFGNTEREVIDHLQDYATPQLAEQIRLNAEIMADVYDWSLNDVD